MSASSAPKSFQKSGIKWQVVRRTVAAVIGGYVATASSSAAVALMLPLERADSTLLTMMLSFLLWTVLAIHAFSAGSERRSWAILCGITLVSFGYLWKMGV